MKALRADPALWRILEERASALMFQEQAEATDLGEEIVIFQLGEGSYSAPAQFIREVQPLGELTPLPATPPCIAGLVNVRGRLLAALDIRPLLEIAQAPLGLNPLLLVLIVNGVEIGLLADTVLEVRRSAEELVPLPSASAGRGAVWVRGVDRHLNLRLDPCALLSDPRLHVEATLS